MSSVAIVLGPPRSLSHCQVPLSSLSFLSWKAANSSAWGLVQCCPWLAERDWRKAPLGSCFPTARCQVVSPWLCHCAPRCRDGAHPSFFSLPKHPPPTWPCWAGLPPLWPRGVSSQVPTPVHPLQGLVAFAVHSPLCSCPARAQQSADALASSACGLAPPAVSLPLFPSQTGMSLGNF